jgi:hypothetical protein
MHKIIQLAFLCENSESVTLSPPAIPPISKGLIVFFCIYNSDIIILAQLVAKNKDLRKSRLTRADLTDRDKILR